MTIVQVLIEALESLNSNKLRSVLTILGIVIGVGAVIAMLAIGHGAQDSITGTISSHGTNLLFIAPGISKYHLPTTHATPTHDVDYLLNPIQSPLRAEAAALHQ